MVVYSLDSALRIRDHLLKAYAGELSVRDYRAHLVEVPKVVIANASKGTRFRRVLGDVRRVHPPDGIVETQQTGNRLVWIPSDKHKACIWKGL
jgi:hypothetical protein